MADNKNKIYFGKDHLYSVKYTIQYYALDIILSKYNFNSETSRKTITLKLRSLTRVHLKVTNWKK
jgi:hypothetical protein